MIRGIGVCVTVLRKSGFWVTAAAQWLIAANVEGNLIVHIEREAGRGQVTDKTRAGLQACQLSLETNQEVLLKLKTLSVKKKKE